MMPNIAQTKENVEDAELLQMFAIESLRAKAFNFIVDKYKQKLYWHIRRMVINHDDADDILQETFIKAWKFLDKFRQDASLYTWLYKISSNTTFTFLENKKKRALQTLNTEENYLENTLKAEQNFDATKIEWKLQMAINTLPEKQKAVFLLRYYDEMPYSEMSKVFETSEGALKASYHIAAQKIEEFFKEN